MKLKFKNQKLTIGQLKSGKIQENIYSDTEIQVMSIAKSWLSADEKFLAYTSGSTGVPKPVWLDKNVMRYSADQTMKLLDPEGVFKQMLLCINPAYIGGIMVVIRAMIHQLDLTVIEPSGNLSTVEGTFDLVSMVPLQVQYLIDHRPDQLSEFRNILIGGAPLPDQYCHRLSAFSGTTCYHTYGMTETASHFALRNLSKGELAYKAVGDVELTQDDRGCLRIRGSVTANQWLTTNDIVEICSANTFIFKGRADHVINSGGVKVHPEQLEARLAEQISESFFVYGRSDNRLGQQVTLVIEGTGNRDKLDFSRLHPYEKPREIVYLPRFVYTESGKVNRTETLMMIE